MLSERRFLPWSLLQNATLTNCIDVSPLAARLMVSQNVKAILFCHSDLREESWF